MAYPEVPDQTYSYTGFSQSLGDGSFPGPAMDTDMAAIFGSLEEFQTFLQGSFRSDGVLKVTALPAAQDIAEYSEEFLADVTEQADAAAASASAASVSADAASASAAAAAASAAAHGSAVFTTPGAATWVCPAGVTRAKVTVVGGGGAGASSGTTGGGGGGGAGGCSIRFFTSLVPETTYNLTVGAAGAASNFVGPGVTLTGNGGATGTSVGVTGPGGAGGTAANGHLNFTGGGGVNGLLTDSTVAIGGAGGSSIFGGGGRGGTTGASGTSVGTDGGAPGAGGGGGAATSGGPASGGTGASGAVIIEFSGSGTVDDVLVG